MNTIIVITVIIIYIYSSVNKYIKTRKDYNYSYYYKKWWIAITTIILQFILIAIIFVVIITIIVIIFDW